MKQLAFGWAGTLGVLVCGCFAALIVLAVMTGCDLRIRANMLAFVGCMGAVAVLVVAGLWSVWRVALR
ncbi:MAG: hypothetical protein FJX72_13405 [Armatimonadetes bacterium]|nr:hypothetical protein [Armatimonadota bacterium]